VADVDVSFAVCQMTNKGCYCFVVASVRH